MTQQKNIEYSKCGRTGRTSYTKPKRINSSVHHKIWQRFKTEIILGPTKSQIYAEQMRSSFHFLKSAGMLYTLCMYKKSRISSPSVLSFEYARFAKWRNRESRSSPHLSKKVSLKPAHYTADACLTLKSQLSTQNSKEKNIKK